MNIAQILWIIFAIISTMSLLSLSVYIYLAVKGNSCTLYEFEKSSSFSRSPKVTVFSALVAIGFLVCMFQGAEAMLFWIPSEWGGYDADGTYTSLKQYFAGLFTLGSLAFLQPISRSTVEKVGKNRYLEQCIELDNLIEAYSSIGSLNALKTRYTKTIEAIEEESQEIGLVDMILGCEQSPELERIYIYKDLISKIDDRLSSIYEVSQQLDKRIERAISNAVSAEKKKREEEIQRKAKDADDKRRKEELARQIQEYKNALTASTQRERYKIVSRLEDLDDDGSPYLLDPIWVARKWKTFEQASMMLRVSEQDINRGTKPAYPINTLFGAFAGISVAPRYTIMARYSGDSHGGTTELFAELEGREPSYLDAITTPSSSDALLAAFYIAFELPTIGHFWHGLYGRDYTLIFTEDQLINLLINLMGAVPSSTEVGRISCPPGIRIARVGDAYRISCLANYPNGTIVDKTARIDSGHIAIEAECKVIESTAQLFY